MTTPHKALRDDQLDYRVFREIKDESDALAFLDGRIASPVGKSYFTPADYRWYTMSLKAFLMDEHSRKWNSLWGVLHRRQKKLDDRKFGLIEEVVVRAMAANMNHLDDWVQSRYEVAGSSYLRPMLFSRSKVEAGDGWDKSDTLDEAIKEGITYYWKQVMPEQEDPVDGRRHCILVSVKYHEEAPLRGGQKPFGWR